MPTFKSRYDYRKLYRPNGMKYSIGKAQIIPTAIFNAELEFVKEFGYIPKQEHMVFEVMGITGGWSATLNEIKD